MANITIGGRLVSNARFANIDPIYGPYDNDKAALAALGNRVTNANCIGLTVGIKQSDGTIKEFWLQPAGENTPLRLVEKNTDLTKSQELTTTQKHELAANINDRPADVVAETGVVNALGYKVLDPNKRFAEQVIETNTTYEIRYAFDLNSETVDILSGCVLYFNGGKLSNGTLNLGTGVSVKSDDVKIFNGITFTGIVNSQYFHIDWFVENYTDTISMSAPDATSEIQAMFNCGIKKIWLTNKHHYKITQTIVVDSKISIDGVKQQNAHNSNSNYWFGNIAAPLVKIQTIGRTNNVLVNNLYLYRVMDSTTVNVENNYRKDVTTFFVDCSQGSIWGLKANVILDYSEFKTILYPLDGKTQIEEWAMGYRGIEVYCANGNYITYADFGGEVWGYWEGIYIHTDDLEETWMTGLKISFNSVCVFGGTIKNEVYLSGLHQTNAKLPYNDRGYFEVSSTCIVNDCCIWDSSYGKAKNDTKLFTTYYSIKAPVIWGGEELFDSFSENAKNIKNNWIQPISGNANIGANIIPAYFFMKSEGDTFGTIRVPITEITFKYFETDADYDAFIAGDRTKGVALTKNNVNGFSNLFCPDQLFVDNLTNYNVNIARKATISSPVKVLFLGIGASYFKNATIVVAQFFGSKIESITIDNGSGNPRVFSSNLKDRYNPIFVPLSGAPYSWKTHSGEIRVTIKYTQAVTNYSIPYIGLCTRGYGDLIGPSGGYVYGDLQLNSCSVKELDIKGLKNSSGTFDDRPSSPYVGFPYFCTSFGKPIFWNGTSWVDSNGETVGLQVSDTSVLIGAAGNSVTINVYHANALAVSALNPDNTPATWLTVPDNIAVGTNTLTISAAANEAANPRGAKVIINDGTDVVIVNVVQNYATT